MGNTKIVSEAFEICNDITEETTSLYEALADMEVEEARVQIALIELKLNNIKLKLDEV